MNVRISRGALKSQTGVGMMEVLAAMFVLSVGLLGVAALQTQGIQAGQTASLRTLAVIGAKDIVERMRANPPGVRGDGGASYVATEESAGAGNGCDDVVGGAARAAACTPAQLAQHDIFKWKQSLAAALPEGNGSIAVANANNPATVTVTVVWNERGDPLTYITQTQMFTD